MPTYSKEGSLDSFSRKTLAKIIKGSLNHIKEQQLLLKYNQEKYTQERIATFLGLKRSEDLSNAKNDSPSISIEKMQSIALQIFKYFPELVLTKDHEVRLNDNPEILIQQLAEKLALNLIDVSTSFEETIDDYDKILNNPSLVLQRQDVDEVIRERYIAVVGAGASHAATLGKNPIPSSEKAIEELFKAFKGKVDQDLIRDEVKRLNRFNRSAKENFETQLLAFHKFGPEIVKEKLIELCGNSNTPCLIYEILAHLLKHRFLDAIINFNYDELLDGAIAEELPNSEDYRFIYTAGHCPTKLKELQIDNRIKQPIYIKCHGTISQPNSLRFTHGQAFLIEEAIQKHILELFDGEVDNYNKRLALNLLVIGFGMENHAFNKIIEDTVVNKKQEVKIWLFDNNPDLAKRIGKKFSHLSEDQISRIKIIPIPLQNEHALQNELIRLWNEVNECFKNPYKPQGIARHEFISYIFNHISPLDIGPEPKKSDARKEYYRDRLYIELFILIIKSNGIVHLSQISGGRVGKYLELLYQEKDRTSIHDYLKNIGMEVYEGFMYDTYLIRNEAFGDQEKVIATLKKRLSNGNLLSGNTRAMIKRKPKTFQHYCDRILARRLLKVNPKYFHKHDHLFSHLTERDVMNTSFSWIYNYRRNIETKIDDWDLMLTVTEEGGFLYGDVKSPEFEEKKFEIILATYGTAGSSPRSSTKLNNLNLLSDGLKYRPWWLHNKHLVLLLKRRSTIYTGNWENDWDLVEGYFYRHSMLSQRVNPVKIVHRRDLKRLLYIFAIYWHGAKEDPSEFSNHDAEMGIVATGSHIEEIIKELLQPFEDKRQQKE